MSVVVTASSALKILVPEASVTLVATKVPKRLASPPPLLSTTLLLSVLVAALIAKSRVPVLLTVTVDPLMLPKVLKTKRRLALMVMAPILLVLRAARLRITSLPAVVSPPPPVIAALR